MVDIDIRTIDGYENQPFNEETGFYPGQTESPLVRIFDPAFDDGYNEPRGGGIGTEEVSLPNPRDISNIIAPQNGETGNDLNASDWLWQWGQFLDHDLGLSEGTQITQDIPTQEIFNIPILDTENDPLFGNAFTSIPFSRIPAAEGTGVEGSPRTVVNEITSFIDGSNGYGSTFIRAAAKRVDLGYSFFGQAQGEIVEIDGQQFLEVPVGEEEALEIEGEEGSEEEGTGGTELIPLPPGEPLYNGHLLVANDSFGTNGIEFEGGSDPNNTSGEILAPYNRNDSPNADPNNLVPNDQEFISGDIRINEQVGLISIHTLFIREHNFIADKIAFHLDAGDDPALTAAYEEYRDVYVPSLELGFEPTEAQIRGEFLYEAARAIVAAKNQVITYEEFLPILIGNEGAEDLETISDDILSPDIAVEFSGAAFRLGHTLINDNIRTIDEDGVGSYSLRDAFFTPQAISQNGVDNILLGLNYQQSNDIDVNVIDGVRNNLFGPPGAGGLDLVAINIQRGRELGIPGYVEVYNQLNPDSPITSFEDLNPIFGEDVAALFVEAYDNIEDIDLWLAGLAEIPAEEGILLGPTFSAILADQFARLRDYDSFFYTEQLANEDSFLSVVSNAIDLDLEEVRLADIIRNHVSTPELVPDDAFTVPFEGDPISGTNGNDNNAFPTGSAVFGTGQGDLIYALAGNDEVVAGEGDDIVLGGTGADTLKGEAGADTLVGGDGGDNLIAQGAGDVLSGGLGNDSFTINISQASGVQIHEATGADTLSLVTGEGENITNVDISLINPTPNFVGIKKSGRDLILDINQDGIIDPEQDLTLIDYFSEDGGTSGGTVEELGNLTAEQIIEYTQSDPISGGSTVYRFFNPSVGVHFYTASEPERDFVQENLPNYDFEGPSYIGAPQDEDILTGARPVYRFLNTDTSVHLYTISEAERDVVLTLPNYNYEGVAYYGYETEQEGTIPLYRFYNSVVDTHFYTPTAAERDNVLAALPDYELEGGVTEDGTITGITYYVQPLPEV